MSGLPRRVLHVMNGAAGGAALSTVGLMQGLRRLGVEAAAVCLDAGSAEEKARLLEACDGRTLFMPLYVWNKKIRARAWKRPLIEARQIAQTGAACWSSLKVADAVRRFQARLIHTNTILTIEGGAAARRTKVPHVWHVRELVGPGAPFRLPIEGPRLGTYLALHASAVVANSFATAERLRPWLPEGLLEVVENGIDLSPFSRRGAAGPKVVVGMLANLTSRTKKHALFLDAIAALPKDLPVEARIYGHGAPAADGSTADPYVGGLVEKVRRAGLQGRVVFAGFAERPEEALAEIDVLVHPADNESFGRVVLEAWAAEVPVVGVAGGGVGSVVTDEQDGLLAPPDDARSLADRIERLVRDGALRKSLGRRGRQTVERRYSLEACASRMATIYARAMKAPLGARAPRGFIATENT